ncbi:MAG: pyridoxal phosphate-dependent aminotransferase [Syntrophales bacterium]|nr:pyridoxal phosphate-dependent aminotransferase [Syntrophales bacterium]
MRFDIARRSSGLTYEIRNIVNIANKMSDYGIEVIWENIGDPVGKGEKIPEWMKEVLTDILQEDRSYAYSPTKGVDETRKFLAELVNKRGKAKIDSEDIIFFNGLGDAIARTYGSMRVDARIIMPEPTYSTHLLAEVLHASFPPNTYQMDPHNNWCPDIHEMEQKVKSHKSIVGILVINPDNPTGFVYPENILKQIVKIARENDIFLVFDEMYNNIIFNGVETVPLSDIIEDVPGISMKGISKEFPWPGARCGWIEVYNADKDEAFDTFINTILNQKMAEVCSTTFPQLAIPILFDHPKYQQYLESRIKRYEKLSNIAYNILKDVPYVIANRTNGAFYMTVVFKESVLDNGHALRIDQSDIKQFIEKIVSEKIEPDKRFVYYLLGATGICVVPLTSFFTRLHGFRLTLLEKDEAKFEFTIRKIAEKIVEYVESS